MHLYLQVFWYIAYTPGINNDNKLLHCYFIIRNQLEMTNSAAKLSYLFNRNVLRNSNCVIAQIEYLTILKCSNMMTVFLLELTRLFFTQPKCTFLLIILFIIHFTGAKLTNYTKYPQIYLLLNTEQCNYINLKIIVQNFVKKCPQH